MLRSLVGIVNHSNTTRIMTLYQCIPSNTILPTLGTISNIGFNNRLLKGTTRSLLSQLLSNNITALLSSVLRPEEQLLLHIVKPIFDSINNYLKSDNSTKERCKWKSMQFIAPHINF